MLFLLLTCIFAMSSAQNSDVCSQVQLMSQYCASQADGSGNGSSGGRAIKYTELEGQMNAKFEELEGRLIREFGQPPEVNYTAVDLTIAERFKGVEARVIQQLGTPPEVNYTAIDQNIQQRFRSLEARVNGDGEEQSIVDYSRIDRSIGEKFAALQVHIDKQYARLVNDTELYQKAVQEMNRRMNISDCRDIKLEDAKLCNATGGVFDIYRGTKKYEVFCDSYTDGGGWTVFQRRMDGSVDFNRTWDEYVNGFGDRSGEFWLGLQSIHELVQGGTNELRIDIMDSSGRVRFIKYRDFHIFGKTKAYQLLLTGGGQGDLPNSFAASSGNRFAALDKDSYNCASTQLGGWWFYGGRCDYTHLNRKYESTLAWYRYPNIVRSEMKLRRIEDD